MRRPMKDKLMHILKNLDAYFAGTLFFITICIVVINVFTRKIFNYVLPWGEEVATSLFVYTVFVGAAWCLRTRQHVGVDLLVNKLPKSARSIVHIITDALIVVLNAYITFLSYQFIISSKLKTMPVLKISSVWLNTALIIGFGLMTIYSLIHVVNDIRFFGQETEEEVVE